MHLRYGGIAQLARAPALQAGGLRFESAYLHQFKCLDIFIILSLNIDFEK